MRQYLPFSPVEIVFTSRKEAIVYLKDLVFGGDRSLLLASEGRINALGSGQWISDLKDSGKIIHLSQIPVNPTVLDVYSNLKMLQGTQLNQIIAIGGGSCIDLAKAISALHYLIQEDKLSVQSVRNAIKDKKYLNGHRFIDVIAVPTTSGTGSEVTKWATIWDMEQKEKLSVDSVNSFPKVALIAPDITTSVPARLSLSTGLDALSHAMEAFWARSRSPLSQALAISAIELVKKFLPQVLNDGRNAEYREGMSLASLLAGLAFSMTRTTACHSISYPLTMHFGVEHGFATAMTLIQVAERNEAVVPEISRIYSIFGGKTAFIQWFKDVTHPVLDLKLSAFGVYLTDLDFIAERTFTQGRMDNNPITFSQQEVKDILQKAF